MTYWTLLRIKRRAEEMRLIDIDKEIEKLEKKIESLKEELRWLRINKPDQTGKARQGIFKIKFMILNVK